MSHARSWEKGKKRWGPLGEKAVCKGECQTLVRSGLVTCGHLARDGEASFVRLDSPSFLKQDTSLWLEYWDECRLSQDEKMKSSSTANLGWIHNTTKPQEGKQSKYSSGNQGSCTDWDTVCTEVDCKVMARGCPRLISGTWTLG